MWTTSLIVIASLVATVLCQGNLFLNYAAHGDHVVHSFSVSETIWISLNSYACPKSACDAGTCSHLYCGTSNGACVDKLDQQWTVSINQVAFTYACCTGSTVDTCGEPANAGGFITLLPTRVSGSGPITYTGAYRQCQPVSTGQWDWKATIDVAAIQAFCQGNNQGSKYTGWTSAIAPVALQNVPGGSSYAVVSVSSSNNKVDPVFFNASVGFGVNPPPTPGSSLALSYRNGPTPGIYETIDCGAAAQWSPPPASSCGTFSSCQGSCGCSYMSMVNRTYNPNGCGPDCPTTKFLFQLCLLCDYGFSYLAVCNRQQGETVITGLDGTGSGLDGSTYTGLQGCTYQIDNGGKIPSGCTGIKWSKGSCGWASGKCDLFPITVAGDVSDYTFQFGAHAGQGQTLQVINLNSGACAYGTCPDGQIIPRDGSCPCPTAAPPPPPPSPTPSPDPSSTPSPTHSPTPSPTPTSTTGCPPGLCGANCDRCCYTTPGSLFQGYCVPTANSWVLTLVQNGYPVPIGAKRPNDTTNENCQLDCECNIVNVPCNCTADSPECICHCDGTCRADPVCGVVVSTPPPGATCPPCPLATESGLECNGKGVCSCGTCVCADLPNAGGAACDEPTNGGQHTECLPCTLNLFTWCDLAGVFACMPEEDCTTFGGIDTPCELLPPGGVCEGNCTCPDSDESHGVCTTLDSVSQCKCDKNYHGGDCCSRGGLSKAAVAGIAGGIIAAIVIGGLVAFAIIGYGVKRGIDWVQLRNINMAAAHNNPLHTPATVECVNALHVPNDG